MNSGTGTSGTLVFLLCPWLKAGAEGGIESVWAGDIGVLMAAGLLAGPVF